MYAKIWLVVPAKGEHDTRRRRGIMNWFTLILISARPGFSQQEFLLKSQIRKLQILQSFSET